MGTACFRVTSVADPDFHAGLEEAERGCSYRSAVIVWERKLAFQSWSWHTEHLTAIICQ